MNDRYTLDENLLTPLQSEKSEKVVDAGRDAVHRRTLNRWMYIPVFVLGMVFGMALIKGEVSSWYRLQEMFRLDSYELYATLGSAVLTAAILLQLMRAAGLKTLQGERIAVVKKTFSRGNIWGGLLFGAGWALAGACPGPLYALLGAGYLPLLITIAGAIIGTLLYALLRDFLPH
jgi:uncharacterized protein